MENTEGKKTKKSKRKPRMQTEWKRDKRKRLIIAGEPHFSVKGELVGSKVIGDDCKCKLKCYEKVSEASRQMLFDGFYALKSYDEQNAYLFGLIRKHDIKRKKNLLSERRSCTYKYYIRIKGKEILVCKIAFAHIHAISFRKIRTLSEKLDQNILFPRDGRGKHNNRPKRVSPDTIDSIKNHIHDVIQSNTLKTFVRDDKTSPTALEINVGKLYINYIQVNEPDAYDDETSEVKIGSSPKVKSWLYRKIFQEEVKPKVYQMIRKRLVALNNFQLDETDSLADEEDAPPKRKSRRKGTARKFVESNSNDNNMQPTLFQNANLRGFGPQVTEISVPCLSAAPNQKPMHIIANYQPENQAVQDMNHVNKDLANLGQNQMIVIGGPLFEQRTHQYQDNGNVGQHVIDLNDMNNTFLYSSHC